MGSLQAESDIKLDLNDSGYGQDEPLTMKKQASVENGHSSCHLLDLSDDVLLYVLRYLSPMDLKSLAFTCSRLGALVLDRTLWERVDARAQPVGPLRLKWFLQHALSAATNELLLSGYARQAEGCLGHMNCKYKEVEEARSTMDSFGEGPSTSDAAGTSSGFDPSNRRGIIRGGPVIQIYDTMPSFLDAVSAPTRPEGIPPTTCVAVVVSAVGASAVHIRATCFPMSEAFGPDMGTDWAPPDNSCPGPQYTLTQGLLRDLETNCPCITSLALEFCNIDCTMRNISHFPRTLKKLSLRGSKCYNQPLDKTFLFKIQDYLTELEELDVSECDWIEPSSLLPLSKLPALQRLYMRRCCKMTECVAYSSLATRYGFRALKIIDLRESPVGDSEVSSFGWVASLEELYVSPAPETPPVVTHAHYIGDQLPHHVELDPWEEEEPDYFRTKLFKPKQPDLESNSGGDNGNDGPGNLKRKKPDIPVVCACRPPTEESPEEVAAKKLKPSEVNDGASTSKWSPSTDPPPLRYFNSKSPEPGPSNAPDTPPSGAKAEPNPGPANEEEPGPSNPPDVSVRQEDLPRYHRYIHFRHNDTPVIVDRPTGDVDRPDRPADRPDRPDRDRHPRNPEPVHKILYVNVGRRLNAMYRLSMPAYAVAENENVPAENPRRQDAPFSTPRFDPTALISDNTVHRFGRAESDNINYINIGPHGVQYESHVARPDRSNLRVLSMTGFRNITNRSLVHLATAAPMLRLVDFSGTRVTERGVENFRSHNPDCEVIFTTEKKEE